MKPLLMIALITLVALGQEPLVKQGDSELAVLKFSWTKYRQNSGLIHGVDDPPTLNEPIHIVPPPARNESDAVRNKRDMNERRAEMAAAEQNASNSVMRGSDFYVLKLDVKNTGATVIKNFIWEVDSAADAKDYQPRQYLCAIKAKPGETKTIEIISPFNPSKVITVADKKPETSKGGKAIVNRIEYLDGSIWKRTGWSILIPKELTAGLENGKCVGF